MRLGILDCDYNPAMAQLSEKQKKHLRRLAHPLSPIVMLGNAGLTDGVVKELDRALTDHELVKVSARVGERSARDAALDDFAQQTAQRNRAAHRQCRCLLPPQRADRQDLLPDA